MKTAIFSDIHGKFLLPFKLVDLYQKATGNKVDVILQCGDMGAFPDLKKLDKATIRHAKNDRDELGFYDDFIKENKEIKSLLDDLDIDMICVRGNHEDHDFLDKLEAKNPNKTYFPIDIYKRIWVCKSGVVQKIERKDKVLNVVGIGRIGDRKGRSNKQFIQDYERKVIQKLLKTKEHFDILITHDKDDSSERGYGMAEIRKVLDNVMFYYHFYGHTGEPFNIQKDFNSITTSCKIKELEFSSTGILPKGCMIILTKIEDEKFEVEVVDTNITNQLTKFNWKY